MSRAMIEAFFPAELDRIRRLYPPVHRVLDGRLFPPSIAERCPEVRIELPLSPAGTPLSLRQPILFLSALAGLFIGLMGCLEFGRRRRQRGRTSGTTTTIRRDFYLAVAFGSFGAMNLSALFLHCLLDAPPSSYPASHPWLWTIDAHMTGVSSICLAFASLERLRHTTKENSKRRSDALLRGWILCQVAGLACVLRFLLFSGGAAASGGTLPLELWYLIPAALAAGPVARVVFGGDDDAGDTSSPSTTTTKRRGRILLAAGFLAGTSGVLLDAPLCVRVGDALWDLPTASTLVFLGCDLAFAGIRLAFPGTEDDGGAKRKTR